MQNNSYQAFNLLCLMSQQPAWTQAEPVFPCMNLINRLGFEVVPFHVTQTCARMLIE